MHVDGHARGEVGNVSFLDTIKSKLNKDDDDGRQQNSYAQDGYDDYYDDDVGTDPYVSYGDETYQTASGAYGADAQTGYGRTGYDDGSSASDGSGNGVLGQTRRGEAESVAVYTRSGQPVGDTDRHAASYSSSSYDGGYRPGAYDTPSSVAESQRNYASSEREAYEADQAARRNAVINGTPQLPAYILRPESYDEVETMVRRVRTRQPVALVFQGVRTETAKRVLDFSYGFAVGSGASVKELGDRVFMVLPEGCEVKDSDLAKLQSEGYLKK